MNILGRFSTSSILGFRFNWSFSSLFQSRKKRLERQHQRHSCYFLGTIKIQSNSTFLDGVITDISKSGLRFRPAKTYILDRRGDQVMCIFSDFRLNGKIVSVGGNGYGITLHEEIEGDNFEGILALNEKSNISSIRSSI